LNAPLGLAFDSAGNLYIADTGNQRVRKVNATTGVITTVAGNGTAGFSGDGNLATGAQLRYPYAVAIDAAGDLFFTDGVNQRVREVSAATGIITTIAGNGTAGFEVEGTIRGNETLDSRFRSERTKIGNFRPRGKAVAQGPMGSQRGDAHRVRTGLMPRFNQKVSAVGDVSAYLPGPSSAAEIPRAR
jgi:hypothetical protein